MNPPLRKVFVVVYYIESAAGYRICQTQEYANRFIKERGITYYTLISGTIIQESNV